MMKKFRYIDPSSAKGRNGVIIQCIKFFVGWNVIGYMLYKSMKEVQRKKDPENFDKKTSTQQILAMMGYGHVDAKKYRISFSKGIEKVDKTSDASATTTEESSTS